MQHQRIWPTKEKDIATATKIIQEYVDETGDSFLGLFEVVVNVDKTVKNYRISTWVIALANIFREEYGYDQGDFVTRMVLSKCLVSGHTVH